MIHTIRRITPVALLAVVVLVAALGVRRLLGRR